METLKAIQDLKVSKGSTILITGNPGIGKTSIAYNIAASYAINGQKVLYITFDGSKRVMARKMIAYALNDGRFATMYKENLTEKLKESINNNDILPLIKKNIRFYKMEGYNSVSAVEHVIDEFIKEHENNRLVIIDSLQYLAEPHESPMDKLRKTLKKKNIAGIILNTDVNTNYEADGVLTISSSGFNTFNDNTKVLHITDGIHSIDKEFNYATCRFGEEFK